MQCDRRTGRRAGVGAATVAPAERRAGGSNARRDTNTMIAIVIHRGAEAGKMLAKMLSPGGPQGCPVEGFRS